jgi:transcription initiation factor TFIID TATA-box-binding protein
MSTDLPYKFKIENVVATVTLTITAPINLVSIARKYSDTSYHPERFPGLVMRHASPKGTCLIFSSGKMVITGLRTSDEAPRVVAATIRRLLYCGIPVSAPEITIQNIVATGDFQKIIDLNLAAVVLEYCMYEPEVFPGLIYRMSSPKAVCLLFSTGRIVCTGCTTPEMVAGVFANLYQIVLRSGIAQDPPTPQGLEEFDEDDEVMRFITPISE